MRRIRVLLFVALNVVFCKSAEKEALQPNQETIVVSSWFSSELYPEDPIWWTDPPDISEIRYTLDRQPVLRFSPRDDRYEGSTFEINPSVTYQTMLGIGTSLDGTTIYAIRKSGAARQVLQELIDPENGVGFSIFRIAIGSSDFSDGRSVSDHPKGFYSLQDSRDGEFSIQNDIDLGIVETLRATVDVAEEVGHPVEFFASSWSAPPWMKTSNALIGGTLKDGYAPQLAVYFRRFIEAYEAEGIPIFAMTMQNEPNYLPPSYPGMLLTWQQELELVEAVHNEFHSAPSPLNVQLWINDHNFEHWINADSILSALEVKGKREIVDAVAFHNYSAAPASNMRLLRERHPGLRVVFTEHSEWGVAGMFNIQQYFRHGAESYVYWVTGSTSDLEEHNQSPFNRIPELSPTLMVLTENGWYRTPEYFLLSQFARFIRPNSRRVYIDEGSVDGLTAVAFVNPDGSTVAIFVNQTEYDQSFRLLFGNQQIVSSVPYKSVATFVW